MKKDNENEIEIRGTEGSENSYQMPFFKYI